MALVHSPSHKSLFTAHPIWESNAPQKKIVSVEQNAEQIV